MSKQPENDDIPSKPQEDVIATIPQSESLVDVPYWKIKRAIDFLVALTVVTLISPILILLSVLVFLDVGLPVVFWQQRVGRNGAPLHLYKFRTLQTLFCRRTKERREAQESSAIGRFLQRTHFDELPQLWNVLSGDMSLIGPRPLLPVDQPNDCSVRLAVRPGLTGWAQVCGGKLITIEEKTALDEWYIRHASLRLDAIIVLRTIWMLLVTGDCRDEEAISTAISDIAETKNIGRTEFINAAVETKDEPDGLIKIETVSV
jgi:lipopolysaccharide/colanic/teichoic acid biosynthesis glycosyltransferase